MEKHIKKYTGYYTVSYTHLTPRECARLQGFQDSFVIPVSDSQAYKQFGNAVTVNVSKAVAQSVKTTLMNLGEWED